MKKFKFYKQLDQMDCGPTCLKMIAKHYGAIYSVEYFRDKSAISNQGGNIIRAESCSREYRIKDTKCKSAFW